MASIVSFRSVANSSSLPIVVFLDMQQGYLARLRYLMISWIDRTLDNCRRVFDRSRRVGLPLAFVPSIDGSLLFRRVAPFATWIEGFGPGRNKMVFERGSPAYYFGEPFTALIDQSRGGIGHLRGKSASHILDDKPADDVHRAVSKITGLHGEVYETTDWIASIIPRKLGYGTNAGG